MLFAAIRWGIERVLGVRHTREPLDAVRQAVESGSATLLDVREISEWDAGHLRHAVLLPLSRIRTGVSTEELAHLMPPGRPVYIHCHAGGRALIAASKLGGAGYDVRPLEQSFTELVHAGFADTAPPRPIR